MTWAARARAVIPQGANTLSKQHVRYGVGPAVLDQAEGPWVYCPDGERYYDYCAGLAAVTLGHGHPDVSEAVARAVRFGVLHLPTTTEVDASEEFCFAVGAEQVRWVSTGSEATEGAVRIARMATGRDVVVSIGYHSWFSTFTAAKPWHPGCPDRFRDVLWDVPFGDLEALHGAFKHSGERIAAVIMEPMQAEIPGVGDYVQAVRSLCTNRGALLIFDEIISGFRYAVRGGAAFFGVEPDLQCYGKVITNGAVPAACIVGPAQYMRHAWPVSGTANAHPLAMAAVRAVLWTYKRRDVIRRLYQEAATLDVALTTAAKAIPGLLYTPNWTLRPRIAFANDPESIALSAFLHQCVRGSVLWQPSGANVMMPDEGRAQANAVVAQAAIETAQAWVADPESVKAGLVGAPLSPTGLRA